MIEVDEHDGGRSVGKVIWHTTMSLDGFIADPHDSIAAFLEKSTEPSALANEVIQTTGVFMIGGRLFRGDVSDIYGGAWEGEVFVYTRSPREAPGDAPYRYVTGDIREVVGEALEVAGGKNVVVTGGTVPGLCVEAGLVDEIVVHVAPVLLGDGVRFYDRPGARRTDLERVSVEPVGQITEFRFRVLK
jgi:riboflavin biosynthesis pyrimidine reductase